jgi:hypothetical protein
MEKSLYPYSLTYLGIKYLLYLNWGNHNPFRTVLPSNLTYMNMTKKCPILKPRLGQLLIQASRQVIHYTNSKHEN